MISFYFVGREVMQMDNKVQVKGTLPLVADFFGTSEKRIFEIIDLDLSISNKKITEEEAALIKKEEGKRNDKKTTNKSKTI